MSCSVRTVMVGDGISVSSPQKGDRRFSSSRAESRRRRPHRHPDRRCQDRCCTRVLSRAACCSHTSSCPRATYTRHRGPGSRIRNSGRMCPRDHQVAAASHAPSYTLVYRSTRPRYRCPDRPCLAQPCKQKESFLGMRRARSGSETSSTGPLRPRQHRACGVSRPRLDHAPTDERDIVARSLEFLHVTHIRSKFPFDSQRDAEPVRHLRHRLHHLQVQLAFQALGNLHLQTVVDLHQRLDPPSLSPPRDEDVLVHDPLGLFHDICSRLLNWCRESETISLFAGPVVSTTTSTDVSNASR